MERSRLTGWPGIRLPSVVTRAVSGPMSADQPDPSHVVAVRQTPLTATLSPCRSSDPSGVRMVNLKPDTVRVNSATIPTASMRPVNITLDQDVRSHLFDLALDQGGRRERAVLEKRNAPFAQPRRRHVELDVVDDALVPGGPLHLRPALEHETLHIQLRQDGECSRQAGPRH